MIISPLLLIYFLFCVIFKQIDVFLIIIGTILLHEFGHYLMIKVFKGKVKKIKFSLIGAIMDVSLKEKYYTNKYYISNLLIAMGRNRYEWNYNFNC